MTRMPRYQNGGSSSDSPRAYDHDRDGAAVLSSAPDFANGTPWPLPAVPAELADLESGPQDRPTLADLHPGPRDRPTPYEPYAFFDDSDADPDADSIDADLTEPVDLEQLEPAMDPVRIIELEADEIGTRTLMGVGARAVRAVATAGVMEGRAARRGLSPTSGQPSPQTPTTPLDAPASGPPAVIISSQIWKDGSFPVAAAATASSVQPPRQPQDSLAYPVLPRAAVEAVAPMAAPAQAEPGFEPWWADGAAVQDQPPAPRALGRILAIAGLALALVGIGVSIGMAGI